MAVPLSGDMAVAAGDMAVAAGDMAVAAGDMAVAADLTMAAKKTEVAVGMGGNNFAPAAVTIKVGETVRWTWVGGNHTVTSGGLEGATPDNKFCNPKNLDCANAPVSGVGTVFEFTFQKAGTYPYYCAPHYFAGMKGTVTVQ